MVDFGGANVAKPLHVGHMRTILVGESVSRIIRFFGHKTIGDVHLGDYGLQIGQVIYGILNTMDVSIKEFEKIRINKQEQRGAFEKKIYLEEAE